MRLPDGQTERCGKPGPLPSPPERSAAKRRRRSGEGQARAAKRARIGGGHQDGNADNPQWALTGILSGFTGHEHDPDVGLINMKGRIYDPAIGRFISADPYVQYPFWGQGLNRYSYGFNNPMSGSDPTGFGWLDKVFGDSSGWEITAAVAGFGTAVGAAAYAVHLGQGGSVSAGGLAGASGLGGAYAIGEAFMGLNDPGANATYAAPTGELGQGALYYEGSQGGLYNESAVAPPAGPDFRVAEEPCMGVWTEQGCSYSMYDNAGGLPIIVPTGDIVRGFQSAWSWLFGVDKAAEAAEAAAAAATPQSVGAMARGVRVLQTGGNTIRSGTAKGLNDYFGLGLHAREWGRALEGLKGALTLPPKHHGSILSNGNYLDDAGRVLGNIVDYLP